MTTWPKYYFSDNISPMSKLRWSAPELSAIALGVPNVVVDKWPLPLLLVLKDTTSLTHRLCSLVTSQRWPPSFVKSLHRQPITRFLSICAQSSHTKQSLCLTSLKVRMTTCRTSDYLQGKLSDRPFSFAVNASAVQDRLCFINAVVSFNWEITQCRQTAPWEMWKMTIKLYLKFINFLHRLLILAFFFSRQYW